MKCSDILTEAASSLWTVVTFQQKLLVAYELYDLRTEAVSNLWTVVILQQKVLVAYEL
jgi:hypothetical protein